MFKSRILHISASISLMLGLFACEKDELFTATLEGTPTFTSDVQTPLVLTRGEGALDAATFSWTPVTFPEKKVADINNTDVDDVTMKYFLQLDAKGDNFQSPVNILMGYGSLVEKTFTVAELNKALLAAKMPVNEELVLEARLWATLGKNSAGVVSNPLDLTVTAYEEVTFAPIFMVGSATENGWSETKATPMFIGETEGTFTYTGLFNAGEIKFLKTQTAWVPMWGLDDNGNLIKRPTDPDPDPKSIQVATEGYYTITVDTANLTYTFAPFDASAATSYAEIGMVGAFTNWSSDELLTQSTFDPHQWTTEYTFAADTPMKFRTPGSWTTNWGPETEAQRDLPFGKGVQDGKDINAFAGTYIIHFNDLTGHYMFIKK